MNKGFSLNLNAKSKTLQFKKPLFTVIVWLKIRYSNQVRIQKKAF